MTFTALHLKQNTTCFPGRGLCTCVSLRKNGYIVVFPPENGYIVDVLSGEFWLSSNFSRSYSRIFPEENLPYSHFPTCQLNQDLSRKDPEFLMFSINIQESCHMKN